MTIFEFEENREKNALMKVVGVGGAGGNAVNRMVDEDLEGVEFISMNTDAQALRSSRAAVTMQIGKKLTRGLGAGARPEVGRQAVAESEEEIRKVLRGATSSSSRRAWVAAPAPARRRWSARSRAAWGRW
jgi:cell division protein FtsZ